MDSNPSVKFNLDIGQRHIIVELRGGHKLKKKLRGIQKESNPSAQFLFLTLEKDIQ